MRDLNWKNWELATEAKWSHVEEMLGSIGEMAGALGSTLPNTNVEIRIVEDIATSESEKSENVTQVRRKETVPQVEVRMPESATEVAPSPRIANLKPPHPETVTRTEVQEINEIRAPLQANFRTGQTSGSGIHFGGEKENEIRKEMEKPNDITSFQGEQRHTRIGEMIIEENDIKDVIFNEWAVGIVKAIVIIGQIQAQTIGK